LNRINKILLPLVIVSAVCSVIIAVVGILLFNQLITENMTQAIEISSTMVQDKFDTYKSSTKLAAENMAANQELARAIAGKDRNRILSVASGLVTVFGVETCTITDGNGIVLARTHDSRFGDSVADQANVQSALTGKALTVLEPGAIVRLSVRTGAPVYDESNTIVGVVIPGYRLDDSGFVDWLKHITGCEISMYFGDNCVSTTLTDSVTGERLIDVTADSNVSSQVLSGQSYIEKTNLMGKEAYVKYFPIYGGVENKAVGMLHVGKYTNDSSEILLSIVKNSMIAMLIIMTGVAVLAVFSYRRRVNRLQEELKAGSYRRRDDDGAGDDRVTRSDDSARDNSSGNPDSYDNGGSYGSYPENHGSRGSHDHDSHPGNYDSHSHPESYDSHSHPKSYDSHAGSYDSHPESYDSHGSHGSYNSRPGSSSGSYDNPGNYSSHTGSFDNDDNHENYNNAHSSRGAQAPINAETDMPRPVSWGTATRPVGKDVSALKRGSRSFSDIIDMSNAPQVNPKKSEIIPANYRVSSLIDDVISDIRMRTENLLIRVALNIDSSIPRNLVGDQIRIRQILLDIISCTVKSTKKANIYLGIRGEIKDRESVVLKIIVMDTSMMTNREDMERVLGDDVQFDVMRGEGIEGTDMDLGVTRDLVQAMDGNIYASSEYGKGTKFMVLLPQKYISADKLASVKNPHEKNSLVFERRKLYAISLKLSMKNLGVGCAYVSTSNELVEKLASTKYSFVFIASKLFERNRDILSRIPSHTKIVLLTEQGEGVGDKDLITLTLPAHTMAIADILNSVPDNSSSDWAIVPTRRNGNRMSGGEKKAPGDQKEDLHILQETGSTESLKNKLHILRPALNDLNIRVISGAIGSLREYTGWADVGDDVKNILQKILIGDYNAAGVLIDALLRKLG